MKKTINKIFFPKIEEAKIALEKLIGANLEIDYDSYKDNNDDEEYGHYIYTIINPKPIEDSNNDHVVSIAIYEKGEVQFFFDATPYPVFANTFHEKYLMIQALIHCPIYFEKITIEDYKKFINDIKDNL